MGMDPHPPTVASQPDAGPCSQAPSRHYAMQVRAFIEAAEVVDADPETLEDILDGFNGTILTAGDYDEYEDKDRDGVDVQNANGRSQHSLEPTAEDEDEEEPEDDEEAEYEALLDEAWTEDEIEQIKTDLKEKGSTSFINEYVIGRAIPIPRLLYALGVSLCKELRLKCRRTQLYFLQVAMYHVLQKREKLEMYNTIDDAVDLIKNARRIIILTGAGISVSCGIPDFRSRTGLYARLQEEGRYDLDDPQQMFDIQYFRENPAVFYSFASQIYPSNFIPSPCHRFIKLIEDKGKLLRNYTQNIDTLETRAGVRNVLQCHGSFATASCINCHNRVPGNAIESDIMNHTIPLCRSCTTTPAVTKAKKKGKKKRHPWESDGEEEPDIPAYPSGIMKPDITFFGEKLTDDFDKALVEDRPLVDLLLVIGTSLKVSPVSEILTHLRHSVPQILINKTPVKHINPDIVLLGSADEIVQHLCRRLGWGLPEQLPATNGAALEVERPNLRKRPSATFELDPQRVGNSHVWLFEGAEGGKWVEEMERKYQNPALASPLGSDSSLSELEDNDLPQAKKIRTE